MSADNKTAAPAQGYTLRVHIDDTRHYDCTFCSASSPDLDAARAHHAVHVAGPELLAAAKGLLETRGAVKEARTRADYEMLIARTKADGDKLAAAVAKAEPTKGTTTP